jgi:putative pyruvate formate lyase activating enzyme
MPYYMSCNYPEINRKVTKYEYNKVLSKAKELHLEGFMQDNCSSSDSYVPDFNLEGII